MTNKELVKTALSQIIEKRNTTFEDVCSLFDSSYEQCVDGAKINFDDFWKHTQSLHKHTRKMKVEIISIVAENDTVFTKHKVFVTTENGRESIVKVFAQFKIRENKIFFCDELTFVEKDAQLGSVLN